MEITNNSSTTSPSLAEDDPDILSEEWTPLSRSIFMHNVKPLCLGTQVYRAIQLHASGAKEELAVKLVRRSQTHHNEINMLVKLAKHPNIVRIVNSGNCKGITPHIYIAMELCHQTLREYVVTNTFDLKISAAFFRQILEAVAFIHSNNIIHRDLKPDNILISFKGDIKLSDFGISKEIAPGRSAATVTSVGIGTEGYKAPEMYLSETEIGYRADIYSLAINAYFIFTHGDHPFGKTPLEWLVNITQNKNPDLSGIGAFPNASKRGQIIGLLKRMLAFKPHDRPTAEEALTDAFFTDQPNVIQNSNVLQSVTGGSGFLNISNSVINIQVGKQNDEGIEKMQNVLPQETSPPAESQIPDKPSTSTSSVDEKCVQSATENMHVNHLSENQCGAFESSIIVFDRETEHLQRVNTRNEDVTKMHEYNEEMKENNFVAVALNNFIYVSVTRMLYRIKSNDITAQWERMPDCTEKRIASFQLAVAVKDSILFVGSFPSKSTLQFTPSRYQWTQLKDKQMKTVNFAVAASEEYVYCLGGKVNGRLPTDKVERLHLASNSWEYSIPMLQARHSGSAVSDGEDIFSVGGVNRVGRHMSVEKFDRKMLQWTIITPMNRFNLRSHFIDGHLYVVGGHNKRDIEKFENGRWTSMKIHELEVDESVCIKIPLTSD